MRVITVTGCRLVAPPPVQSVTVKDVIDREAKDLTDFERVALGDYLAAVVLYGQRAYRLCGVAP